MTHSPRASLAPLLALALMCGCRADDRGGGAHAPPELTPVLGAVCDLIDRCPDLPPLASRSRAECIDIVYWALTCRLTGSTGVERVPLSLDGPGAEACARFLEGLSCEELTCLSDGSCPEGAACAELFSGLGGGDDDADDTAGPGERCYRYGSPGCDSAHFCAPEAYDEVDHVMLCEVCVPRLAAGAPCDWNAPAPECETGLRCLRDPSGTGTPTCGPIRADGDPCSGESECASGFCGNSTCLSGGHAGDACTENYECRWMEDLTCVMGTCGPARSAGEPCAEGNDCRGGSCHTDGLCGLPDGERCDGSTDCRTGYCPSFTVCMPRLSDGAACTFDDMCSSQHCDPATMRCAARPPRQPIGGPCSEPGDCEEGLSCDSTCYQPCGDSCPDGLVCIYTRRSECLPPLADGSSCDDNESCLSGFCNDAEVCAIRPGIGDPCTGFSDCYPLGYCSGGVCAARRGPDESCEGYDSCLHPFICQEGRCTLISLLCEPAPVGQPCTFLQFCAPEAVCDFSSFTCVARQGRGEECSGSITGRGDNCAPGLHCATDESGASTCQPRIAEGSACMPGDVCAEGTYCTAGVCTASPGGGECHGDGECPLATYCNDRSDTCEPFRQEGDSCDAGSSDTNLCDPALQCDRTMGVCARRPRLGEECDRDSWCDEGATCSDTSSGMCVARAALGAPCATSYDDPLGSNCAMGLYCNTDVSPSVCATRIALGEPCDSSDECENRVCEEGRCLARAECVLPDAP